MAQFSGRHLALLIQAVDRQINDLRARPEDQTVPEDEERLLAFEQLAEELADAYEVARGTEVGLLHMDLLLKASR